MSVHNAYAAAREEREEREEEGGAAAIRIERGECHEWIQSAVCCTHKYSNKYKCNHKYEYEHKHVCTCICMFLCALLLHSLPFFKTKAACANPPKPAAEAAEAAKSITNKNAKSPKSSSSSSRRRQRRRQQAAEAAAAANPFHRRRLTENPFQLLFKSQPNYKKSFRARECFGKIQKRTNVEKSAEKKIERKAKQKPSKEIRKRK